VAAEGQLPCALFRLTGRRFRLAWATVAGWVFGLQERRLPLPMHEALLEAASFEGSA